jgi:phosphate transport system ATP-binding protein
MTQELLPKILTKNLSIYYGNKKAVDNVSLEMNSGVVTAIIGPSGCGKSTFIRALNRMHDFTENTRVEGKILLDNQDIYDKSIDPCILRRKVGMVFQKPNPFPHMSIMENV